MTDDKELVERWNCDCEHINPDWTANWVEVVRALDYDALRAERDAEKLKRQQVEHERDCILEDLAGAGEVLKAWDQFWSKQEGDWPPLNSTRAFLAGERKP